jgi:hypothetical protein
MSVTLSTRRGRIAKWEFIILINIAVDETVVWYESRHLW